MDGALVVHEVLHSIHESQQENFVIKLDMIKAYDRVKWEFLFEVLSKFSFSNKWCKWIKNCISGVHFSILINGHPSQFIQGTQGIRQGDPLSPFLFIIMADALSRYINFQSSKGLWLGATLPGTSITVTHSLFTDDTLLFGKYSLKEAKLIKQTLDIYSSTSGQKINAAKSKIFIFNTSPIISLRICKTLGFSMDQLPSSYLGIPFFMGSNKPSYWSTVIGRIQA